MGISATYFSLYTLIVFSFLGLSKSFSLHEKEHRLIKKKHRLIKKEQEILNFLQGNKNPSLRVSFETGLIVKTYYLGFEVTDSKVKIIRAAKDDYQDCRNEGHRGGRKDKESFSRIKDYFGGLIFVPRVSSKKWGGRKDE